MKQRKKLKILAVCIPTALLILLAVYFGTYYHADATAEKALQGNSAVKVSQISQGGYLFDGPSDDTAVIFYPGAKVETSAYAPLLLQIAEQDADVYLLDMPLHMAFFGINKADRIRENDENDYRHWYMAGHSLGAAMAASYAASHLSEYRGLILLAGYPPKDLHADDFSLLSVYGSEDMDPAMMQKKSQNRPEDYTESVISGGNHAQFGNYGIQKGDGTARISAEEQQKQAVKAIHDYLRKQNRKSGAKVSGKNERSASKTEDSCDPFTIHTSLHFYNRFRVS